MTLVCHLVTCAHSELGVGPGILRILSPKSPTDPKFASAKACPEPSRVQKVVPVAPAAAREADVLQDNIHLLKQLFKCTLR